MCPGHYNTFPIQKKLLHVSQAPPTWLYRLVPFEGPLKGWPLLQSLQVLLEDWIFLEQHSFLDHRRPPYIVPNHTVCSCEPVSTDVLFPTEIVWNDICTNVEFAHHRVNQGPVSLFLRSVCQLHVQWFQDIVTCASSIADETGGDRGCAQCSLLLVFHGIQIHHCVQSTSMHWQKYILSRHVHTHSCNVGPTVSWYQGNTANLKPQWLTLSPPKP